MASAKRPGCGYWPDAGIRAGAVGTDGHPGLTTFPGMSNAMRPQYACSSAGCLSARCDLRRGEQQFDAEGAISPARHLRRLGCLG